MNAGVAELADALDLGSSVTDVGVQVLSPAPKRNDNFHKKIVVSFCTINYSFFTILYSPNCRF